MNNEQPSQTQHNDDEISLVEIISILWKYKLLIILLPIVLAVAAYIGSQFLTPSYSSTTKLYLGNYESEMYTNTNSAQQVIMSNDVLRAVMNNQELNHERPRDLRESVSVETLNEEAKMLEITANHSDPERAQQIVDGIATQFVNQAQPAFQERQSIIEERYQAAQESYSQISESLERNEQTLQDIEDNQSSSEAETDLARARLIDYIEKNQSQLLELEQQLQKQELNLNNLNGPEVFEQAVVPQAPDSPSPMLNTAIAFVIGAMAGVGLAFVIEFFRNNPIRRRKA
ncbi:YveK family protein [Salibacterium halotolerans]|uniref:Chain length determinant protein n=1 Tax=Salibacterium halotolerans TaxID=1884432 RepID=A0A1I5XWD5_9BACI|nr:Wzz/FepE/Etk N-terminal domain-containing protein [Salibacterium halotolerans]SFQ36234.1 Chain length determinant protein [Salibacterium halotolerans]